MCVSVCMGKAGDGEEGSDAAFFMPRKNRARREKSNVPLQKEGGKIQIKDTIFSSKTDC